MGFLSLVEAILTFAKVPPRQRDDMLSPRNLVRFSTAFVHDVKGDYDPDHNHTPFTTLGHESLVKAIAWYFPRKWPTLFLEPYANKPIGHLHMVYDQENRFGSYLLQQFDIWQYIQMAPERREELERKDRLCHEHNIVFTGADTRTEVVQKVFEAMLAVVEWVMDDLYADGVGNQVVMGMVWEMMDRMPVPDFHYESLVDPSTRLNNHFVTGDRVITYKEDKVRGADGLFRCTVHYKGQPIATGAHPSNSNEAKRVASHEAWKWIHHHRIPLLKPINEGWQRFHDAVERTKRI